MERQMKTNQMMSHKGKKEIGAVRDGNKKSWITPRLVKINASRSTEFGPDPEFDGEAGMGS